ncbi:hypothetical protein [Nitrincola sp.]|uniref:hypothetical protein n=1 Tax=Nitrincola sp. TaxID=1926584 RepID=UPI003A8DE1A4
MLHNSPNGNVQICVKDDFADGKPVKVVLSYLSDEKMNKLLIQAEQLINKAKKYGVLGFNCEHLASAMLHGNPSSEQLQGTAFGAVVGLLLAHRNQSRNSLMYMSIGGLIECVTVNAARKYDYVE